MKSEVAGPPDQPIPNADITYVRAPSEVRPGYETPEPLTLLGKEVCERVSRSGAVVVLDVPVNDDALLLALAMGLGEPSEVGNGDGVIHEVKPRPLEEQRDVSSTRDEFGLHTDSTALVEPHDYVCLACSQAEADAGGESLVLNVEVVVELLRQYGEEHLAALEEPVFPFPLNDPAAGTGIHEVPVLASRSGAYTIRYRADTLAMGMAARPDTLATEHRDALSALECLLLDPPGSASHLLRPGEVLVIDNRRMLHGRTAIRSGAKRHLRRLKVYAQRQ